MRDDGNGSGIDNLSYVYPASGRKTINNRLNHIVDRTAAHGGGSGVVTQNPGNYSYDATGNRVVKDYHATQNTTLTSRTWTIRDAQGTVLAIYTRKPTAGNSGSVTRTEAPIYGSSRVGQSTRTATYDATASGEATLLGTVYSRELGKRAYELVDHLGNVRATISDILVPRTATNTYDADILTLADYYPFGMQMDTRTWEASGVAGHRYGYNGKENDDEVKGQGNQQDYGFRIYDPRVARFLSVDPLARDYPAWSTYAFSMNSPISGIDLDGLEYFYAADGTLLGKYGTSESVRKVDQDKVETVKTYLEWALTSKNAKDRAFNEKQIFDNSSDVGMIHREIVVRGMLYAIRMSENYGSEPLRYDAQYGGNTFRAGASDEVKYASHPNEKKERWGKKSTAAGAYQFLIETWRKDYLEKYPKIFTDFSPTSQDRAAARLLSGRKAVMSALEADDPLKASSLLNGTWTSLPGGKHTGSNSPTPDDIVSWFRKGISLELSGNSALSAPKGALLLESIQSSQSTPAKKQPE
jgi:RHS repeat-associated protein